MMYDWNNGPGWAGWVAMGFMMILFWGLVVALVVFLVRGVGHRPDVQSGTGGSPEDAALRVLRERFARGEIDADEYTTRRDLLRRS